MITIKSITKSFGSLQVLKGIDLQINKGEVVSIVGPSGAGKTTLLQIIGTLDRPDGGEVVVDGVDVGTLSSKKLSDFRNLHLGFIFQFHQLLPEFTALENVMIPAYIAGKKKSEALERANELLTFLGLADRANHKPAELSGGEKQRVAVARALVDYIAQRETMSPPEGKLPLWSEYRNLCRDARRNTSAIGSFVGGANLPIVVQTSSKTSPNAQEQRPDAILLSMGSFSSPMVRRSLGYLPSLWIVVMLHQRP